jgi:16S rRNA (adenine1518-N6/adenine1519-N6)-dimethyltransferase
MSFPLAAKKSLGQHFLIDPKVHQRIVKSVVPTNEDVVIEIGPGTGLLTRHLLATPLRRLIAFELDFRAIPVLREEFHDTRFEVVEADFLQANLNDIAMGNGPLRVVGNIPYYITSPILFKLIDDRACLRDATLLIQREVAERLVAKPSTKAYGIPTVLANFFGNVRLLFHVPAGSFRPVPRVDSSVVTIDFQNDFFRRTGVLRPPNFDETRFRVLVRTLFGMRRKTVRNNLKGLLDNQTVSALESSGSRRFLDLRSEAMALEDFFELDNTLFELRT